VGRRKEKRLTRPAADALAIELEEQLPVWRALWDRREEIAATARAVFEPGLRRVLFTGCGDCHAAAEYGAALLGLRSRLEARAFPAMELSRACSYLLGPETLLVALSISGRTPRVVEAVRAAGRAGSAVLGITDDPDSPLAAEAPATLLLATAPDEALHRTDYRDAEAAQYVGYHRAVAQTKTYGAAQLALALLDLAWEEGAPSDRGSKRSALEQALGDLPSAGAAAAEVGRAAAAGLRDRIPSKAPVTFCGAGLGFSSARFAAYKVLELACPAYFSETEEYCHTHYLVTGARSPVLFLAQDEAALRRAREIVPVLRDEIGAAPLVLRSCGERLAEAPELSLPVVPPEAAPLLLSHACAHLVRETALGWGVNTDRFRAGEEEERYVRGSTRMIRRSEILG
jgi:glutamine---fructose-6-phosphate transaminase (isomerizing)